MSVTILPQDNYGSKDHIPSLMKQYENSDFSVTALVILLMMFHTLTCMYMYKVCFHNMSIIKARKRASSTEVHTSHWRIQDLTWGGGGLCQRGGEG